jgi:hypothetical protein
MASTTGQGLSKFVMGLLVVASSTVALAAERSPTTAPTKTARVTVPGLPAVVTGAPAKRPLRVLFIGNSYTFFNGGLGTLVQSMASAVKDGRRLEYVEVTKGGQTLEGHWADGKALAEIRKGGWDFVVLQEHSLRPLQDREKMFAYAKRFDGEIRRVGARTVFYETWARKNRPEMQGLLDQAYSGIAKEVAAVVAPAGLAWQAALKVKPDLSLHIADLSHPTPAGSYLNACVFYETFFGRSPEGLPRTIKDRAGKVLVELTDSEATLLQHAAFETCGRGAKNSTAAGAVVTQ